ncbi:MAG: methyl-accepting chemotaxis protein [Chthoniobacterales bacterium]|nr:methyl-accepting chemotaxis protein [Chthoniobacterales bacterium]
MKITTRVFLLSIIPSLVSVIFCAIILQNAFKESKELKILKSNVTLLEKLAELVRLLQLERGQSSILVSGGSNQGGVLDIRNKADALLPEFKNLLEENEDFEQVRGFALNSLDRISSLRKMVDARAPSSDVVAGYSEVIRNLVELTSFAVKKELIYGFSKDFTNLSLLLGISESVGINRGTASGILTSNNPVSTQEMAKLLNTFGAALSGLRSPVLDLPADLAEKKEFILKSQDVQKIAEFNEKILEKFQVGSYGIPPSDYFSAATNIIESLNGLIDGQINSTLARLLGVERRIRNKQAFISLLFVVILAGFSFGIYSITRTVKQRTNELITRMKDLAEGQGDLTLRFNESGSDELTDVAKSLNQFIAKVERIVILIRNKIHSQFALNSHVFNSTKAILTESDSIYRQSLSISEASREFSNNISLMAETAEKFSNSASSVATAIEELHASVNEIETICQKEREKTSDARDKMEDAALNMAELLEATRQIGQFTETITTIAKQTNLLALNASIEAATAGEAGRGFAVVANEIKNLASKSASAAFDITQKLENIQKLCNSVSNSVNSASQAIRELEELAATIANSVTQQTSVTSEIAQNASSISRGSESLSHNIESAARKAKEIDTAIQNALHFTNITKAIAHISSDGGISLQHASDQVHDAINLFTLSSLRYNFEEIKKAHIAWLDRFVNSLITGEQLDLDRVKNSTICMLGKWLAEVDPTGAPEFRPVRQAHDRFHQLMFEIAQSISIGKFDAKLNALQEVTEVRKRLFDELDDLALKTLIRENPAKTLSQLVSKN